MQKELRTIPKTAPSDAVQKKVQLLQALEQLKDSVTQSTNFKAKKDVTSNFSREEKRILQAMMEVLTRNFSRETVNSLYKDFLKEINAKGKK